MAFLSDTIKKNLEAVEARIETALKVSLRNRSGLTLIAVSKRQPLAVVEAAHGLGLNHFGENQIQEGVPKVSAAPDDITWHFIGRLQKNKVRKAVNHFRFLHSIDSLSLLQRVDNVSGEERVKPKVLLQVNYALDPDKQGLHPDAVAPVLEAGLSMKNLTCIGLMGIPPLSANADHIQTYFNGLAGLRDDLKTRFPDWPGKLSMGMSGDLEIAIKCGANFIRVGSALLGERH